VYVLVPTKLKSEVAAAATLMHLVLQNLRLKRWAVRNESSSKEPKMRTWYSLATESCTPNGAKAAATDLSGVARMIDGDTVRLCGGIELPLQVLEGWK
jgi:hypothetical protein